MLTNRHIDALVVRDTAIIADALLRAQVLGTELGDRVLAAISNHPDRRNALDAELTRRGHPAEFAA